MDIKLRLKQYNITLSEFAAMLFLSRPTLNTYIKLFENQRKIPDKKYQILFDRLFSQELDEEKFRENITQGNLLLAKDNVLETTKLSPERTDLLNFIIEDMKSDLETLDADEEFYIFIRVIINNYKKISIIRDFSNYFLALNSFINFNDLSKKEKIKVVSYFQFIKTQKNVKINNYEKWEELFIERIAEIKKENDIQEKKIAEKIKEIVTAEMKKQIDTGKNVSSITAEEILNNITKE